MPAPTLNNLESPANLEYTAVSELRTELHQTHANLLSHIDARVIDDLLAEHDTINAQVTTLRDLIHGSSSRL